MLSIFCAPSRYVQGAHATRELGRQLTAVGLAGPAYLVATARVRRLLQPTWESALGEAGIPFVLGDFGGECTTREIEAGVERGRAAAVACVIGAGGGKALDTARGIAAGLGVPVVNCPTIASSDAPCSALSVVYHEDGTFERLSYYPRNPELVLVDTSLVAAAPVRYLVAGMGDALATWFEARTVSDAHSVNEVHGLPTRTARALAETCYRTLLEDGVSAVQAVEAGAVTPALDRIAEANTLLSGLGFESGGLAVAHSVHNGLTSAPGTHSYLHGEKVAFGLLVQLVLEGRPAAEIEEVLGFSRSVGLPTTLAAIGVDESDRALLAAVAERTVAPQESAHHEPFEVTAPMVLDAILAADRAGAPD